MEESGGQNEAKNNEERKEGSVMSIQNEDKSGSGIKMREKD